MWNELSKTGNFRSVLIDLPGHGESVDMLASSESMWKMASEVQRVLGQLGIEKFVVVGHSMGGYVGLELMKMESGCERILLLNSNFWADSADKKKDRKRVADIVFKNKQLFIYEAIPNLFLNPKMHDAKVKELIQEAILMSPEAIAAGSIAMSIRIDNTEWIEANGNRVTIVQGAEDRIVPENIMEENLANVNCNYISVAEVGHMAHIEASEEVEKILADFIAEK